MKHTALTTATLAAGLAVGTLVTPIGVGTAAADDPGVDCAEWSAEDFTAEVGRLNPYMVTVTFTYDDGDEPFDVCPYTIFYDLLDGDGDSVWDAWVTADSVASETESIVGGATMLIPFEGCDWQVRVAVEESLPTYLDSTDLCIDDLRFTIEPLVPVVPLPPVWTLPVRSFAGLR